MQQPYAIELKGITKTFGSVVANHDVSLNVRQGEILALLKRIVRQIRNRFSDTVLLFRADSHHCKPAVHAWCEAHNAEFVIGLGPNRALDRQFEFSLKTA